MKIRHDDFGNSLVVAVEKEVLYCWKTRTLLNVAQNIPAKLVDISSLQQELDNDRWFREFNKPTVREILGHFLRIQNADLNYPIILSPSGRVYFVK